MSSAPVSPFKGRWLIATVAVILLTIVFLLLCAWQLQRRAQRLEANARVVARLEQPPLALTGQPVDVAQADLRRATVRGVFDYDQEIVLRNRTWNELPGVHVLVPLKIDGTDTAVLVDRGWIPYEDAAPADRAKYRNATGDAEVYGILRQTQVRQGPIAPDDPTPMRDKRVDNWHRVDLAKIQKQVPYSLLPIFLEEDVRPGENPRAFPKPQPDISLDEGSHLSYAIQWFFFALVASAGYIGYFRQKTTPKSPRARPRPSVKGPSAQV